MLFKNLVKCKWGKTLLSAKIQDQPRWEHAWNSKSNSCKDLMMTFHYTEKKWHHRPFNLLLYWMWLMFGYKMMRIWVCMWGVGVRKTREVIYDAVETEAVRESWLCTYWLLQVSEFICYASSIAGLLPEGHTAVIQRAASTSGACRGGRQSDRFGEEREAREGWEGRWGCRRIESVEGGRECRGVCVWD